MLALGFGASQAEAVARPRARSARRSTRRSADYGRAGRLRQLAEQAAALEELHGLKPPDRRQLDDEYYLSANVVKASEDKTFPGAIVASLASPWGQAVSAGDPNNTYFGSYREVFARDLYEAWTGLMADGDFATARDATLFLFDRQQQADGSMPRNSLVNGKTAPDSFGTQLDEAAYPILMADQLGMTERPLPEPHQAGGRTSSSRTGHPSASSAGRSRAATRPRPSPPRSPASSPRPTSRKPTATRPRRALWLGVADDWQRSVKGWTVTTNGPLGSPRTSSGSRRPATRTPRSPTTSATAARRSTSARSSTRASSSWCGWASCPPTTPTSSSRSRSSTRRSRRHAERPGLAPLQRRRLRRRRDRRPPLGAERPGNRPPLAGALRRARRAGPRRGRRGRRGRRCCSG